MTKIYLITHLDSGMKYVGITDGDLAKRWQQHYNDPNSAVYSALRSEGYRMTMELLDDVPSRDEALRKEQEYIRTLGTAQPHGWNRTCKTTIDFEEKIGMPNPYKKKWRKMDGRMPNRLKLFGSLCLSEYRHSGFDSDTFAPLDYFHQYAAKKRYLLDDDNQYELFKYVLVYNNVDIVHYGGTPDFEDQAEFCPYEWTPDGWHAGPIYRTSYTCDEIIINSWKLVLLHAHMEGYQLCDIYNYERKAFISDKKISPLSYIEVYK
jgi:hypothetical protein